MPFTSAASPRLSAGRQYYVLPENVKIHEGVKRIGMGKKEKGELYACSARTGSVSACLTGNCLTPELLLLKRKDREVVVVGRWGKNGNLGGRAGMCGTR